MPKPATVIESKVEPNPALEKRTHRVFTADYKLSSQGKRMIIL